MPAIGTSGSMSGDGKRGVGHSAPSYRAHPRLYHLRKAQAEHFKSESTPKADLVQKAPYAASARWSLNRDNRQTDNQGDLYGAEQTAG